MSDELKEIMKQNEIIISLLGRIAFKPNEILSIVTSKKKNPDSYMNGYNSCNGNKSVSEIARIIGVKQGTISPILSEWNNIGIIYEIEKTGGTFYKRLFKI